MNPDRATLNFLNSFPEDARKRGEMLQKDGAVTQIFGNHLFIQGRVEDEAGTFRTSLRLQGNRWFGSWDLRCRRRLSTDYPAKQWQP